MKSSIASAPTTRRRVRSPGRAFAHTSTFSMRKHLMMNIIFAAIVNDCDKGNLKLPSHIG